MNAQTSIQVGVTQGAVWVRVEGKGNFQNSTSLKEFAREMVTRGHRRFIIDLRSCPLMDSTFMGTLAGIALRLHGSDQGCVDIINMNDRTRSLLSNLGLDQLLQLQPVESVPLDVPTDTKTLSAEPCDKLTQKVTMLEAHEAVVVANPENEAKFKDVLDYLRHDLALKP